MARAANGRLPSAAVHGAGQGAQAERPHRGRGRSADRSARRAAPDRPPLDGGARVEPPAGGHYRLWLPSAARAVVDNGLRAARCNAVRMGLPCRRDGAERDGRLRGICAQRASAGALSALQCFCLLVGEFSAGGGSPYGQSLAAQRTRARGDGSAKRRMDDGKREHQRTAAARLFMVPHPRGMDPHPADVRRPFRPDSGGITARLEFSSRSNRSTVAMRLAILSLSAVSEILNPWTSVFLAGTTAAKASYAFLEMTPSG